MNTLKRIISAGLAAIAVCVTIISLNLTVETVPMEKKQQGVVSTTSVNDVKQDVEAEYTISEETSSSRVDKPSEIVELEEVYSTTLEHVGVVPEWNVAHHGEWVYENTEYECYYDWSNDQISVIHRKNIPDSKKVLSQIELCKITEAYLKNSSVLDIVAEMECTPHAFDGVTYPIEYVEILNGFETGTRAMFFVTPDGTIASAAFIQGTQYEFSAEDMITKNDAIQRARTCLSTSSEKMYNLECTKAELITIKNQIAWHIYMQCPESGRVYYVVVDVYSGDVLECDYSW